MGRPRRDRWVVAAAVCVLLVPAAAVAQPTDLRSDLQGTAAEREAVEVELEDTRARERDARGHLAAVDAELDGAQAELHELEAELEAARAALAAAQEREATARADLVTVTDRLAEAELELADKQERLETRVIAAFKYGQLTFAEVMLASADILEFINSGTYVSKVLQGDRELLADVEGLVAEVTASQRVAQELRVEAATQAELAEASAADVEAALGEQERLVELIEQRRAEREEVFLALREDRSAMEAHLAGLEAESQRIEAQLAAIARQQAEEAARRQAEERAAAEEAARQAELARQQEQERAEREGREPAEPPAEPPAAVGGSDAETATGSLQRPVGGPVTSPFGPRWGRNHNGIDIGAAVGTTVRAAGPGVVVHVTTGCHPTSSWGCGGGFGNYVTIAHPDGLATIYAHLSTADVGVGTSVGAGMPIGTIGNSGNSYGPHLHFEVREAGVPRNPCNYVAC